MLNALLGVVVASGLITSIRGTWIAMKATPIFGADPDGYMATDNTAPLAALRRQQRSAWMHLLVGFALQLAGTMGFIVMAL